TNYWGYNSIGFFAPDPRYAHEREQTLREFKEMVARLHEAGLEVILDVVYNHTAEGNQLGPTLSFKGIDNASYYRLLPDEPRFYINDTGTGNTLNLDHMRVIEMVTDSLRYWAGETHVDGFRFDLGTILAREASGFDNQSGFLKACCQDPELRTVKLVAEPWDCGVEGPTDDEEVNALRARQRRNFLGTLLLSQGTPMLLAGDEFARTQQGNNNAYCQDNEISWVDWDIGEEGEALIRFVQQLTALRHKYPILRRSRFLTGVYNEELGVKDVAWINASGAEMTPEEWGDMSMECFGMLMDGRAQPTGIRRRGEDATLLMVLNGYHDLVGFTLPETVG